MIQYGRGYEIGLLQLKGKIGGSGQLYRTKSLFD